LEGEKGRICSKRAEKKGSRKDAVDGREKEKSCGRMFKMTPEVGMKKKEGKRKWLWHNTVEGGR